MSFELSDFIPDVDSQLYRMIDIEGLKGGALIDTLIYLRFAAKSKVRDVLKQKYNIEFTWLRFDPTPKTLKSVAERHHIMIQQSKSLVIYVPFSVELEVAELSLDIPNYNFASIKYIADSNYNIIKKGLSLDVLSNDVMPLRPLLVYRRLVYDCIDSGGTDIHFESRFNEQKVAEHKIRYRIKRELVDSTFVMDWELIQDVIRGAVEKLSPCSAQDLESDAGITTEISDLFLDGTCEVRVTGSRVAAGFYIVMAIQTTTTTMLKVDELGFPENDVNIIRQLSQRRTGLTLVTGEMRSGKNTTIFAMLNEIVGAPIRIIGYENPIENRMPFPQKNYRGDVDLLMHLMRLAKKEDIDIAELNEIPNSDIAFAVRDLVNSSIGVITTTHIDRVWHVPYKLREFFGDDYKTIISQLNAVINQKMFRKWKSPSLQKRTLIKDQDEFTKFCWKYGVRYFFQPVDLDDVTYGLQPLAEILVLDDSMKLAMANFDEIWRAEQMIQTRIEEQQGRIEHKLADYINRGICSIDEMRRIL